MRNITAIRRPNVISFTFARANRPVARPLPHNPAVAELDDP